MEIFGRRAIIFLAFLIGAQSVLFAEEISGRIQVEPPYPEAKFIKVRKKVQDSCADEQISKALLVSPEGGLANAVIWLESDVILSEAKDLRSFGPSALRMTVVLDQTRCNFEPHVVLVPPGGRMQVRNSDPLAHDVRAFEEATMLFRLDMDTKAKPEERTFDKPGIHTIRCGLHPWMHAFAVQAAHPFYAVTDAKGNFLLKDVPAGKHKLRIWHETLGENSLPLEVSGPVADFSYTFKKA